MIRNDGTSYVPRQLPGSRVWAAKLPSASYRGRPGIRKLVDQRPLSDYVLVDLRDLSMLEPISVGRPEFGVTMYNPDELAKTHRRGRHEYLIALDVLDADVFINIFYCGAVAACAGWWDESLDWHEGSVWPQDAILEDMLEHILRNPQYSNRN